MFNPLAHLSPLPFASLAKGSCLSRAASFSLPLINCHSENLFSSSPTFPLSTTLNQKQTVKQSIVVLKTNHRRTILKVYPPKPLNCVLSSSRLPASSTMRSACLSLLLVTACWALPFRQSGFLDFMMEDEAGSGTEEPRLAMPEGPKCPFRCQCHLRVIQCSDLGKTPPTDGSYGCVQSHALSQRVWDSFFTF